MTRPGGTAQEADLRALRKPTDSVISLTAFELSDAPVLTEADRDPEHRRRFGTPDDFVPSLAHSEAVVTRWAAERDAGTRFPYAVRAVVSGELLGGCELIRRGDGTANLSYWTYPAHRGRGVATRAVALACTLAFDEFGVQRVEVVVEPDNVASRRVALRAGFTEVGMRDDHVLHVLDSQWGWS